MRRWQRTAGRMANSCSSPPLPTAQQSNNGRYEGADSLTDGIPPPRSAWSCLPHRPRRGFSSGHWRPPSIDFRRGLEKVCQGRGQWKNGVLGRRWRHFTGCLPKMMVKVTLWGTVGKSDINMLGHKSEPRKSGSLWCKAENSLKSLLVWNSKKEICCWQRRVTVCPSAEKSPNKSYCHDPFMKGVK